MKLTKEELSNLSYEQLTACIAIHIMGWTIRKENSENPKDHPYLLMKDEGYEVYIDAKSGLFEWSPTVDMNDAMALVETMGDKYNFELNRKPSGVDHLLYESKFIDGENTYSAIDGSAPRSIAISALLAKLS